MKRSNLPKGIGVGFKSQHFADILTSKPELAFLEVHAENFMGAGGPAHAQLGRLAQDYALSVHGVGLNIGAPQPLDREHLRRIRQVCDDYQPASFSEHLAWSSHGENYFADLLPLPYTQETLDCVCDHINEVQDALGRQMLLENPSTYVSFAESSMEETVFLREIVRRTGCGLLLDVNNVFISCVNHERSTKDYISAFPLHAVGEIHLGGHHEDALSDGTKLLIDSHSAAVADPVWQLYSDVIGICGETPTLIEWDNDVPDWPELYTDVRRAQDVANRVGNGVQIAKETVLYGS